jgi:hypothetical protein
MIFPALRFSEWIEPEIEMARKPERKMSQVVSTWLK